MNACSPHFSVALRAILLLSTLWVVYQGVTGYDFTAPSHHTGTAPEIP